MIIMMTNEERDLLIKKSKSFYVVVIKRSFDFMASLLALLILSPLLLIVIILEMIIHGFPVFYKTKRPGKNGKIFNVYKFRSMTNKRDSEGHLLPEKDRLTKFGIFLRKTSIDELPELINILKGDMAVIGPRPLLVEYLDFYNDRHKLRHLVRPGLTCARIVPSNSNTWTWGEQFENDLYYIEHLSLATDIKTFFAIVKEVFKGSEYRANDTRPPFNGHNLDDTRSKDELSPDELMRFDSIDKGDK